MSFPRYPEYKDSGVEWLGQVPSHWRVSSVKREISFTTGWTPPSGDAASYEGEHLWANISDLGPRVIMHTAKHISTDAVRVGGGCVSPTGSLLFSFKLSVGQVSIAGRDMFTNEAIATFLPAADVDLHYAYYEFPIALPMNAAENIYGAKLLNQELIRSAAVLLPPVEEQRTIAAFLDRETAKIDALVAEQERLIELLQEKRQAVISHAVTKGLNPDAPMKDSGIEWIGPIPAHWNVSRLGRLLPEGPRNGISPDAGEGTRPSFSTAAVEGGRVNIASHLKLVDLDERDAGPFLVRRGDILVLRGSGSRERVGIAGLVSEDPPDGCVYPDILIRLRMGPNWDSDYSIYLLNSAAVRVQMELGAQTAAGIWKVSGGALRDLLLPVPALVEQQTIATALAVATKRIDALVAEVRRAVGLLEERRAALISAAVTGQIDVRSVASEAA